MTRPSRDSTVLAAQDSAMREAGTQFLLRLYAALRVIKLYPIENEQSQRALDDLTASAQRLIDADHEIEVRMAGEFLFVNSTRLRLGLDNYATFSHVINTLRQGDVGVLHVQPGVERREWQVFIAQLIAFAGREDDPGKLASLQKMLANAQVRHIEVEGAADGEAFDETQKKAIAKRTYERSVGVTKDLVNSARMGRQASLRRVKRAVQNIVDQVLNNETSMVGLTTIKEYDDYTFTHSVNVCIFSLSIGKRLGLTKLQLYDLGMAALLHDVGKSRVPLEILNKVGGLSDQEWSIMQSHPWLGVLALFDLQGFADIPFRSMVVAHEHHMKVNRTGYPKNRRIESLSMYSKLVTVADIFDAATSRRVYQTTPLQPDKILETMMSNHEKVGTDLVLVKALVNLLGIYPVGTCVILDTYELAIVHAANPDLTHINRPVVRLLIGSNGQPINPAPLTDLATVNETGHYVRSIIKVVDPVKYNIQPQDYFV